LLIAGALGIGAEQCIVDERLLEMQFGEFEGKQVNAYHEFFGGGEQRLTTRPEGGESWTDVKRRAGAFLYDIDVRHQGKKILIVSHNGTMQMLLAAARGDNHEVLGKIIDEDAYDLKNAEVRKMDFTPMPHNDDFELDFHRPYIDEIELFDTDGTKLVRVPDVFDCWFESGSMPYAQNHYPFENLDAFNAEKGKGFPAQFIAEGLDQTRGWFYSLIVLGTALFGKSPFEHVIVNGLVLAEDGKKMSKSLQNYPDPMDLVHRVGADAMRFYLLSSPVIRGEDLSFSEKEVLELQRKNIGRLHNVLAMYEMYQDGTEASAHSQNVLDRWILARLAEVVRDITDGYTNYELDKATRPIEGLIDDLSVWYLRRSRERLKGDDVEDKKATLATLRHVLKTAALLMAPVMPFYAEYLFLRVREEGDKVNAEGREGPLGDAESVHLMPWPKGGGIDPVVLGEMSLVREFVTLALEVRQKANSKVRQPLALLTTKIELAPEYAQIVADEINVKRVMSNPEQEVRVVLDMTITPELKIEGEVRELMRAVQDARKEMGLMPHDRIALTVDDVTKLLVGSFEKEVLRTVGAVEVRVDSVHATHELKVGESVYHFGVVKV
jgi:isoleucyl-tRNA synthetase